MQIDNRAAVFLVLMSLFTFIIFSCGTKDIKTGKYRTPDSGHAESQRVGTSSQISETSIIDDGGTGKEKGETATLAVTTEDSIDPKTLSEIRRLVASPIYFDFDKSTLQPEARSILQELAQWLEKNPKYALQIEGHGDERGPDGYNLALGENRAVAAKKYLHMLGIEMDRISVLSYGEERPADSGHNEAAWAKNRRDEFKLIRKP